MEPYSIGTEVDVAIAPGFIHFPHIYKPAGFDKDHQTYGFSVDVQALPPPLIDGVRSSEHDGKTLVHLKSRARVAVNVDGLPSMEHEFRWLRDREEEMRLRNMPHDWVFKLYPVKIVVTRYQFEVPYSHRRQFGGETGVALSLRSVALLVI